MKIMSLHVKTIVCFYMYTFAPLSTIIIYRVSIAEDLMHLLSIYIKYGNIYRKAINRYIGE